MEKYVKKLIRGVYDLSLNYNQEEALPAFEDMCDSVLKEVLQIHEQNTREKERRELTNENKEIKELTDLKSSLKEEHYRNEAKLKFYLSILENSY